MQKFANKKWLALILNLFLLRVSRLIVLSKCVCLDEISRAMDVIADKEKDMKQLVFVAKQFYDRNVELQKNCDE